MFGAYVTLDRAFVLSTVWESGAWGLNAGRVRCGMVIVFLEH